MRRLLTFIPFLTVLLIGCFPVQGTVVTAQSLRLSPPAATVFVGEQLEIAAPTEVAWEASGGTVTPTKGRTTVYTAPTEAGRYTVTAFDPADPARRAVTVVTVLQKPQGGLNYSLAAYGSFSAAISRDGTVWWWGKASESSTSAVPILLDGLRGARSITVEDYTVEDYGLAVVTENRELYWVGPGLETRRYVDTEVAFADIDSDSYTGRGSYYVKTDGSLWHWDRSKSRRMRVSGRELQQPVAVRDHWSSGSFLVAVDAKGQLWRLLCKYRDDSCVPERLTNPNIRVSQVGFNNYNYNLEFSDSALYTTFLDTEGRLGQVYVGRISAGDLRPDTPEFRPLEGPGVPVRFFAAEGTVILAVDRNGEVWHRQDRDKPWKKVPGLKNIVQVAIGGSHYLALRSDGTIFAWGKNDKGQLGDGTTDDSDTPVEVLGVKARVP